MRGVDELVPGILDILQRSVHQESSVSDGVVYHLTFGDDREDPYVYVKIT